MQPSFVWRSAVRKMMPALLAALAATLGGARCDCGGTGQTACVLGDECGPGYACVDHLCMPADGGVDDAADAPGEDGGAADDGGGPDDSAGEDGARCPSGVFCGTPPECCDAGEECIEGLCAPPCASGVRCGPGLAVCCDAERVCVRDTCETPGEECIDSFDCGEGRFCEPTLGRCLPQLDPVTCEVRREPEPFSVVEEWIWTGSDVLGEYDQPISAPLVVDLDGDRVPEVVVSMARRGDWQDAVVRALRGDSGAEYWTTDASHLLNGRASIAAADIDGDTRPEILGTGTSSPSPVYAFEEDGGFKWASADSAGTPASYAGRSKGIAIADLDGDGFPEIVAGGVVLGADGRERLVVGAGGTEGDNNGYGGGQPTVADLDLDTVPEIVTGARAWRADGTPLWDTSPRPDGYPAVADFDLDGRPEVVIVAAGTVRVHDGASGTLFWGPADIPGGGKGGPPTVADFDGDGFPEIGVAGAGSYSVYDPDGPAEVLWSVVTQDESSNATGSSVFDFEGDGVAEVVYCDECFARVFRGDTGDVLLAIANSSATINEYPLVADVDADGNSEILVVANDYAAREPPWDRCLSRPGFDAPRHGVFVYGDAHDRWVGTRRIWNQHAYHVTNANADGTVPAVEADNWTTAGLNNFRQNVQGTGVYNAPDLAVIGLTVDLGDCPTSATLAARVANVGSLGVAAGVPVSFYEGTIDSLGALLGTVPTAVPLLPGASTLVTLTVTLGPGPSYSFVAVVDDDGTGVGIVEECDEDDNLGAIGEVNCLLI